MRLNVKILLGMLILSLSIVAQARELSVELAPLDRWQEQKFEGQTNYTLMNDNGEVAIQAISNSSASMLLQEIEVDLRKTPYIQWEWKVDSVFSKDDEQAKAGDDYPARIYIAVPNKFLSLYPRALNYVWASESDKNSHWNNPYTDDVIMLAVQSGENNVGQWMKEKRNLREDLKTVFGKEFKKIKGIAIMTDTDNGQHTATAYYKNLRFSEQ